MNPESLSEGLHLFRTGAYFEAHEVLELLWRPLPKGPDREATQALIQLAVSLEHWRRGNPRGAAGQWEKAQGHLRGVPSPWMGIDLDDLLAQFRAFYDRGGEPPWPTPRPSAR